MERGPEPKDLPTNNRQAFNTASLPKKLVVLLGGVTANFIIGLLLLTGLYATGSNVGLPGTTVESTVESSPAQTALEPGDTIVAINGVNVRTQDEFMLQFVQQKPDSVIELQVKRENAVITKEVALGHRQEDASVPYLGLLFSTSRVPDNVALLDAPGRGWEDTSAIVTGTASSLGHLVNPVTIYHHLTGVDKDQSTRAVSLIGVTAATDDVVGMVGWAGLIILLANLNLILAFFNALPLMPLDGGHVLVAFIERIKSRKGKPYQLPTKVLASFSGAVMVVLLLLAAVSMYLDIVDPLRL